jgi:tRNA-binding protein
MISFQDFLRADIRSGTVLRAEPFPEAKKPAYKLWIDFGNEIGVKTASAQITRLYEPGQLEGKQIVAVANFPAMQVASFLSQVLVLGIANENGDVVLLEPERRVPNGARVF